MIDVSYMCASERIYVERHGSYTDSNVGVYLYNSSYLGEGGMGCVSDGPPRAFLHADNDNDVIMTMTGRLAELMVVISP